MRNKKGQFVDGEEGKRFRYKPKDKRLLKNKWRKGLKPKNAFPKGHISANFKGEVPRTVGHGRHKTIVITTPKKIIRISRGKNIKVRKRISYAKYIYQKETGKIPSGFVIYHLNKNPRDNTPENLIAIPRAYLIRLNNSRANIDSLGRYRR